MTQPFRPGRWPRFGAKSAVACCVNRPPVKSAHRMGVAPRESSDVKGRARSPHPACGRFEAAHCAAHLATIRVSGPPLARQPRKRPSRRHSPPERDSKVTRPYENAPPRLPRGRCHAKRQPRPPISRMSAASAAGTVVPARVRRPIASGRAPSAAASPLASPAGFSAGKNT